MSFVQIQSLTDKRPDGTYESRLVWLNPACVNHVRPSQGIQMGQSIITMAFTPHERLGKFDEGRDTHAVNSPMATVASQIMGLVAVTTYSTSMGQPSGEAHVNLSRVKKVTQPPNEEFGTLHFVDGSELDIVDINAVLTGLPN